MTLPVAAALSPISSHPGQGDQADPCCPLGGPPLFGHSFARAPAVDRTTPRAARAPGWFLRSWADPIHTQGPQEGANFGWVLLH